MPRDMQKVQNEIVDYSERLHKLGLRHSGLSGQLCEQLLKRELTKDTQLFYTTGQVTSGNRKSSPQIDLVIHKKPIHNEITKLSKDVNVVPRYDVVGIIEVKKWTFPKMALDIAKKMTVIRRYVKADIPLIHVSIRHKDRHTFVKWEDFERNMKGIQCFCFYGTYRSKNGKAIYPFEEKERGKSYDGQYEALVNFIMRKCMK